MGFVGAGERFEEVGRYLEVDGEDCGSEGREISRERDLGGQDEHVVPGACQQVRRVGWCYDPLDDACCD